MTQLPVAHSLTVIQPNSTSLPARSSSAEPAPESVWRPQRESAAPATDSFAHRVWQPQAPADRGTDPQPWNSNPDYNEPNYGGVGGVGQGGVGQGGMNPILGTALGAAGGVLLYQGLSSLYRPTPTYVHNPAPPSQPESSAGAGYADGSGGNLGGDSGADLTEV